MIITAALGLLVFGVLVIFHEYGHFVAARSLGIRVERFSVGFGPVILRRIRGDVEYAISAFPLGGYVKMAGDDPRLLTEPEPGDFFAAAWWKRVIVALAGPFANLVLAIILSIILTWVGVTLPDSPNLVGEVTEGSVAAELGFRDGDRLVAVDGRPVASLQPIYLGLTEPEDPALADLPAQVEVMRIGGGTATLAVPREQADDLIRGMTFPIPAVVEEVVMAHPAYKAGVAKGDRITAIGEEPIPDWKRLTEVVRANPGTELLFTIEREGQTIQLPVTPIEDRTGETPVGKIGITPLSPVSYTMRFGFGEGVVQGTRAAFMTVALTVEGIASLFTTPSNLAQISGPVAIIQASGEAARAGWDRVLNLGVVLSIALMVFNLLPIPILDGGMVLLSVLEAVRGRPMGERGLAIYQGIGLAVIGTIFLFVLINDPLRIIQRQSALGRATDVAP